jgi:hypothetical protein
MRPGETRAIEVMQETRSFLVPTAAIPKHQQWALERSRSCWTKPKTSSPVRCHRAMEKEKPKRWRTGETVTAPVTERRSCRSQL